MQIIGKDKMAHGLTGSGDHLMHVPGADSNFGLR